MSAQQLGDYYRIDGGKLERAYKEYMCNFRTWEQLEHCTDWVLLKNNLGKSCCIDETMLGKEIYTILSNRDAHGKSGTIIAMVQGTAIETVSSVLMQIPEEKRNAVLEITMDLSDSMRGIAQKCFPKAMITLDSFHISKQITDAIEELRLKAKRSAIVDRRREERKFNNKRAQCKKRNKMYAKIHPRKYEGKKRGRTDICWTIQSCHTR